MRRVLFAAVVLIVGVLAGLTFAVVDRRFDEQALERAALVDAVDTLRGQITSLGERPKVPSPERVIEEGPAGERGERGQRGLRGDEGERGPVGRPPTESEIAAAVADYCARNSCEGPAGEAAPAPTETQVRAAITDYCTSNGCQGSPGPGPSDQQVAVAVADYCARNSCAGPPGPMGPPGPGPTSFSFDGPGNQRYHCTDPDGDGAYSCQSRTAIP